MTATRLNPGNSGWKNLATKADYCKYGNIVTVSIWGIANTGAGVTAKVGTLPIGYRPSVYLATRAHPDGYMDIDTNGDVHIKRDTSSGTSYCVITFVAN